MKLANHNVTEAPPSLQAMVDILPGWNSSFPASLQIKAGAVPLFEDQRVSWTLEVFGNVCERTVLELGSLEGAHTYMLDRAGAIVTAIEANKACFLRGLIAREIMGVQRARLLYGNFIPWLEAGPHKFDIVWANGVLYHMSDPIRFLKLIGNVADKISIWTHYVPDDYVGTKEGWARTISKVKRYQTDDGRAVEYFVRPYGIAARTDEFSGGVYSYCCWLRRSEILTQLRAMRFNCEIGFEMPEHPHGPAFSIAAVRLV